MFTFWAGVPVLVEHEVLHCGIVKAQTYTVSQTVWRGNMPVNNLSASPRHYRVKQHAGGITVVPLPIDSADGPDVRKHSRYKRNMSEESLTVVRVNSLYENMQSQHVQCLSVWGEQAQIKKTLWSSKLQRHRKMVKTGPRPASIKTRVGAEVAAEKHVWRSETLKHRRRFILKT